MVVAGSLAACGAADPGVPLAPGITLKLPSAAQLGREVEAVQRITARYNDQSFAFESRISVTATRLLMVGTDGFGRRAITVEWSDLGMHVETASFFPSVLPATNIVADIMLVHWPAQVLRAQLGPADTQLDERTTSRRILNDGQLLIEITHSAGLAASWSGTWRLTNRARGYTIDIQSVELAP